MTTEFADKVFSIVESIIQRRTNPVEFEVAYQARVAINHIRFAIKVTEHSADQPDLLREARFQLLEALSRLEAADRGFKRRFQALPRDDSPQNT
jgi:hypothetical protein